MRPGPASKKPGVYVIGIAGPSGSGKTTLAQALARESGAVIFALDAYYRDQRHLSEDEIEVDVPEAIEAVLAAEHLRTLIAGRTVDQPVYDFATHTRTDRTISLAPGAIIVVEGLFALYWEELRGLMHTRAFIALDHDECLRRRAARDVRDRGRSQGEVVAMYERKVRPMYDVHVDPTREFADLVLDGRAPIHELARTLLATRPAT